MTEEDEMSGTCEECGEAQEDCICTHEDDEDEEDNRPEQDDINEGICIDQKSGLTFTRRTFKNGEAGEEDYEEDGWVAFYNRGEVARAETEKGLFKKLRAMELKLGSPRIFAVNDHGNVTEYSGAGKVIGEWV